MKTRDAFAQRLLVYSLGAGAASVGASAHASIISYSGPPVSANNIYFSLNGSAPTTTDPGGTEDFSLNTNSGQEGFFKYGGTSLTAVSTGSGFVSPVPTGNPSELSAGTTIGPTSLFTSGIMGAFGLNGQVSLGLNPPGPYGYWTVGTTGFLGLEIVTGGQTDYGWAEVVVNGVPPFNDPGDVSPAADYLTLDAYAYDDSGAAIVTPGAGAVPEPGCTAWLAVGAAGLSMLRRRAKK